MIRHQPASEPETTLRGRLLGATLFVLMLAVTLVATLVQVGAW